MPSVRFVRAAESARTMKLAGIISSQKYLAKSLCVNDSGTDTANTWKGVARDYLTNGIVGTAVKATGHGQGAADLANDLLGPPPEQPSGS